MFGVGRFDHRAAAIAADFLQGVGDPVGLASELNGGCVGQELPLPRHAGLDNPPAEQPDCAERSEAEAKDADDHGAARVVDVAEAAQDQAADHRQSHDAEQDAHQANVEAHVAVQYVTELVPDDALQLVAVQEFQRAARHCHRRVAGAESRGEGVNPAFLLEDINLGHWHAGCDRHFFDDVAQAPPQGVAGIGIEERAAHLAGDPAAAARGQLDGLGDAGADDEQGRHQRDADGNTRRGRQESSERAPIGVVGQQEHHEAHDKRNARDDQQCRDDVGIYQAPGNPACLILCLKEVHGSAPRAPLR